MKRYFLRSFLLAALALAVTISALAVPPDPLAGGSTIVGEEYTPDFTSKHDNPYFDGALKTSSSCIEMLKQMEGYLSKPAGDYQQYSIGYGCNTKYLRQYHEKLDMSKEDMEKILSASDTNYILKEEKAEALMMYVLAEIEAKLDGFLSKYGITANQYQYDALMSFTYNLGYAWMNSTTRLGKVLASGSYTVNELASAMGVYCHVTSGNETKVLDLLVSRRIQEIKLFLYGAYELTAVPQKFCTLTYVCEGGDAYTDIGFYQVGEPYQILFEAEPTEETEAYFAGWYTADGEKITAATKAEGSTTVFARWSDTPADPQLIQNGTAFVPGSAPTLGSDPVVKDPLNDNTWSPVDVTVLFSDMNVGDWHLPYVSELCGRGIIDGYSDRTFRPERKVTTGEALKMILLAAGYEEPETVASHWARHWLNLSLDEGIIDRGEITDLDIPISRRLMAKVVANAMGLSRHSDVQNFTDTNDDYVQALFEYGISDGYSDGTFRPAASLKRSELCAIVCRMLDIVEMQ